MQLCAQMIGRITNLFKYYAHKCTIFYKEYKKPNIKNVCGCATIFLRDFEKFPSNISCLLKDILFRAVFMFNERNTINFYG